MTAMPQPVVGEGYVLTVLETTVVCVSRDLMEQIASFLSMTV